MNVLETRTTKIRGPNKNNIAHYYRLMFILFFFRCFPLVHNPWLHAKVKVRLLIIHSLTLVLSLLLACCCCYHIHDAVMISELCRQME